MIPPWWHQPICKDVQHRDTRHSRQFVRNKDSNGLLKVDRMKLGLFELIYNSGCQMKFLSTSRMCFGGWLPTLVSYVHYSVKAPPIEWIFALNFFLPSHQNCALNFRFSAQHCTKVCLCWTNCAFNDNKHVRNFIPHHGRSVQLVEILLFTANSKRIHSKLFKS